MIFGLFIGIKIVAFNKSDHKIIKGVLTAHLYWIYSVANVMYPTRVFDSVVRCEISLKYLCKV